MSTDLGIQRREIAASTVDAEFVVNSDSRQVVLKLTFASDITGPSDLLATTSLINPKTQAFVTIPAGSQITDFQVRKLKSDNLDTTFTFSLGYICLFIQDSTRKASLATRVSNANEPCAAKLLNQHQVLRFDQRLYAAQVATQNTLYDAEMSAQSLTARTAVDYDIVAGTAVVGESRDLIPCYTALAGTCATTDLQFEITYISP